MTKTEAFELQTRILTGEYGIEKILEIFHDLEGKVLTSEELGGIVEASQNVMTPFPFKGESLDTCGTGGDGLQTFNISTAAALVAAACGVTVAKHGNRAASSRSGSADVLEALGVVITMSPEQAAECLHEIGITFLWAPLYHPAFKHAGEARKQYGKKTYFNFLGPLLNPARADYRLLGVADTRYVESMGEVLLQAGVKRAWLLASEEGMDEISPAAPTTIHEFTPQNRNQFVITPVDVQRPLYPISDLIGGDAQENAEIIRAITENRSTPAQREVVVLNAAAALVVTQKALTMNEAILQVEEALTSGKVAKKLHDFVTFTSTRTA